MGKQDDKPKIITSADLYERLETKVEPRIKRLEVMVAVVIAGGIWDTIGRPTPEDVQAAISQLIGLLF